MQSIIGNLQLLVSHFGDPGSKGWLKNKVGKKKKKKMHEKKVCNSLLVLQDYHYQRNLDIMIILGVSESDWCLNYMKEAGQATIFNKIKISCPPSIDYQS